MSVKTEHRQESFHGTKVYVVNPEQLRQKVVLHSLQLGKSKQIENSSDSSPPANIVPHSVGDRKPRKRRLESDEGVFEDEDDVAYTKICSKEVTTRAGRVSKFRQTGLVPKNPKASTLGSTGVKVKKREPASIFRCPTCQKVYIGYSKLKLHFRKFPDHYNQNKNEQESNHTQDAQGKSTLSTEAVHAETQTDLQKKSADAGVQTVQINNQSSNDSVVRNEPKNFSNFASIVVGNGSAVAEFRNLVPHAQATEFARTFSGKLVPTQKMINITELHAPTPNASHGCENTGHVCATSRGSGCGELSQSSKTDSSGATTFANVGRTSSNGQSHHANDGNPSLNGIFHKLIWDFVEEKMIQHGINEILAELADVADKLSKIARDKIIPIREEEEEQLRINNTAPIVQVDTPFLSHLLDLPFGTYMFKEDAGVRRAPPPPVPADISLNSLTSGVEVDIDKFLPGIDLIHLPHLTNLDFSSI